MQTPHFWRKKGPTSFFLWPLSILYRIGVKLDRIGKHAKKVAVPVICVGNLNAGGAGKTPVAMALARLLGAQSYNVHFLSKGYGAREQGPTRVVPRIHQAKDVGDEPLLLAEIAPTWVCKDRHKGAHMALLNSANVVIADDGFQDFKFHKDISLLVIDGTFGLGNKFLLPAGPLRESISSGLKRATAIIMIGEDKTNLIPKLPSTIPLFKARIEPEQAFKNLKGKRVIAFAGIALPEKFFDLLKDIGANVLEKFSFGDHHHFTTGQIRDILWRAEQANAVAVTTAKDAVRLWQEAREQVVVAGVNIIFDDEAGILNFIQNRLNQYATP